MATASFQIFWLRLPSSGYSNSLKFHASLASLSSSSSSSSSSLKLCCSTAFLKRGNERFPQQHKASSKGMHLPVGLSEDEVCQFATRKRMAFGASSTHTSKKSRIVGPPAARSSADVPPVAPSGVVSGPVVAFHAPVAATSAEVPLNVTRLEENVIIVDAPTMAPMSAAQPTVPAPAPRLTPARWGCSPSPLSPEWMSMPLAQSSVRRKGKVPISAALAGSDSSSRGYTNPEWIDIRVSEGRSAFSDPQLARSLVRAILLLNDQESRRSRTLAHLFESFYLTFIGALLLLGFEADEMDRIKKFLRDLDGEFLKVIYCTEDMIKLSVWDAMHIEQPDLEDVKIAKSLPRICFLSGLSGEEMMMFIDAFPDTGLKPTVFAALVPNSADKLLGDVIEEIMGDHEMLSGKLSS